MTSLPSVPSTRKERNLTEVRTPLNGRASGLRRLSTRTAVSRLYAHSKNYDMDLTLDYNVELYPLEADQSFALALASSLARGPNTAGDEDEKDHDVWRPDGKGRRGLEEDYEYVMYGKVRGLAVRHPAQMTGFIVRVRCTNLTAVSKRLCTFITRVSFAQRLTPTSTGLCMPHLGAC